jgi:hypothetical protein
MKFLETKHEKKSFIITVTITVILLLLCFFFGMTYMDPPPENGIAINFGNMDTGMNNDNSAELTQSAPQPTKSESQPTPASEQVATQDIEEATVIKETKKVKPNKPVKEVIKPIEPKKQTPSKDAAEALKNLMNGPKQDGTTNKSDGDGNTPGNQGALNGSLYANTYYGGAGSGDQGGGKWGLKGRKFSGNKKVQPPCNDEGRVVMEITVNKQGEVIAAQKTINGSNTTSKCLVDAAKEIAMSHRWQPDENAPNTQKGFVVVNFSNGE